MNNEKVREIKELLRCMNGEKACTNCYINDIAQEQETCCINVVADMTLDLINELESENERLENKNYQLEQNLGQCENGYKLELHTARYQLHSVEEDLKKAKDRIANLEQENEILEGTKDRLTFADRIKLVNNATEIKLKQFAERLKDEAFTVFMGEPIVRASTIDKTLEESLYERK